MRRARPSGDDAAVALAPGSGLEDAAVPGGAGPAAGLGFFLAREAGRGRRSIALVAPRDWEAERGRLMARGAAAFGVRAERFLMVRTRTAAETLWALEEVLRSGAADLAIGAAGAPALTLTRRLDMAAREAGAACVLLRAAAVGEASPLSAARRRWRIRPLPSAPDRWDARAPGAPRWRASLERRRDGPPGSWDLEWNDETGRLDLVEGLAGDGLGQAPGPLEFRARAAG